MKILFVTNMYPWPLYDGTRQRQFHLIRALAESHQVTLVCPPADAPADGNPLMQLCERIIEVPFPSEESSPRHNVRWVLGRIGVIFFSPRPKILRSEYSVALSKVLMELRKSGQFDRVWAERTSVAEAVRNAGFTKIIVDLDDVMSISLYRQMRVTPWALASIEGYVDSVKLYFLEKALPNRYWRLLVCKESDRDFFTRGRERIFVVPNGIVGHNAGAPESERLGEMMFVGTMGYEPNADAVAHFMHAIFPRIQAVVPESRLHIVGRNTGVDIRELHDGVRCVVHGLVPDLTPHFATASVFVAPIRAGSGTRLKILEALARGKAVVATTIGAEGLDLRPGVDLEIADDPAAFASACVRLLQNPAERRRLAQCGRKRVLERFTWDAIGEVIRRVVQDGDLEQPVIRPSTELAASGAATLKGANS